MHPAPQFAPYLAPQGGEHYSQALPAGSNVPTAPPPAYQQPQAPTLIFSFAPQTAFQGLRRSDLLLPLIYRSAPQPFYQPYSGGAPVASAGGLFPRTGLQSVLGGPTAAPICRPSTYPISLTQVGMDGFIPVQPAKPLLIHDFLSLNALNALKSAPEKLMVDLQGIGIYVQTDLSGVGTKKMKCPDLPAWLKASDKMKAALAFKLWGPSKGPIVIGTLICA
jgi:hypothetical protein